MAAATKKRKKYVFELPLKVSSEKLMDLQHEHLQSVYLGFAEDLPLLIKFFEKNNLPFIKVKGIAYDKGHSIAFSFEVETEEELEQFYAAGKAKILSKLLTEYAMSNGIGIKAGLKMGESLELFMELGKTEYHRFMAVLCEDDDSEDVHVSSMKKVPKEEVPLPKKTLSDVQEIKKSRTETCCCDFFIYLPAKTANIDFIFLISECKELAKLQMKPVLTCEGMWEGHIDVPVDMMNHATYRYVAQKKDRLFNTVNVYTSELKFKLSDVERFEFLLIDGYLSDMGILRICSTKEGYLTHCIHILNMCNRTDVFCCINQLDRIYRCSFSMDDAVEIMAKLQSVIFNTNVKGLILLALVMLTNVRNIPKFLDTNTVSKDKVKAMLESFRTTDFGQFNEGYRKLLPHLLQNFCFFLCGVDYDLLSFIVWTYPFLDENYFIEEIVSQVNRHKQLFLANGQRYEVLQEVIFLIASRVDVNVQAVGLIERLFRHLPLPLSVKSFRYLFNDALSRNDVHNSMKEKLLPVLIESFLTNMSVNINQGKIPELLSLWEIVQDEEEITCKIKEKLQQIIISYVEKRTDKISSTDLQSLEKIILDTKLFVEKNTHEQLLRSVGQSKVKNLHGLFITFLHNSKFSDCLIQYPHLLLEWFETALKQHLRAENYSNKENEILLCYSYLHDALVVPFLPPDGQLQMKLEEHVFRWLTKIEVKIFLRKLGDIEKLNEKKPLVLELYQKHVQKLLADQYKSSKPEDPLLAVCGTYGHLLVNSSYTSQLVQTMMELYCGPFGNDQYENFINMVKMSKFWMLLLTMEGIQSDNTKNHEVFIKGMTCLNFIIESLESNKINCTYLEKFSKAQDVKELLAATGRKSRKEIDKLWKNIVSIFQKEREKVTCVMKVLPKVKEVVPWNSLPSGWKNLEDHIKDIDKMFKVSKSTTESFVDSTQIWSDCLNLPDICERLFCYIESQVFWNACLHILAEKPELSEQRVQFLEEDDEAFNLEELDDAERDEESRILESLKHIFTEMGHESGSFESCVHFLESLEHHGGLKYREDWMLLCKDEDVPMTHVVNMFKNDANIVTEVSLQEKTLKLSIETRKRQALFGYHKFDKYLEQMKAMEITLCVLEIPLDSDHRFIDAKRSFDKLMSQSIEEITLEQVYEAIKTIHIFAKGWDEDKIQVLKVLGESTLLIQFLRDVADVDLRNLIDAVEEVSEQSVNEATVLGMIDVKRFLQPVLKKNMESDLANLFLTISKQMKDIKPIELVGKIIDCKENLHNLKSLYNNVANRGLKTREIIENVIKMGKFCFEIDTGNVCFMSVEYTHSKKMTTHAQDTLIDLRSRALLMMNTDSKSQTFEITKKKEMLDRFVLFMDTALEIGHLLTNLHMSGHFQYKLYQTKMKASGLKTFKDKLSAEYSSWCARLEDCREKHYWMNFILGNQLHIIHDFLEMDKEKPRVLSVLQFIHPEIKIDGMKEYYSKLPSDGSEYSLIENIALTLEHATKNLQPVCRHVDAGLILSPRITDIVRPGKLSIVALEKNSKLIMKTILALYYNTVKKLPEPHQILFCNQDTTWVEVQLLLHRSVRSKKKNLFSITNVEMLSNEIQFQLVDALHLLSVYGEFLLAVICCGTEDHPFVNEFSDCVMPVHPLSDIAFRNILQKSWPDVCCVSSDVPGLGKTEMIRQRSHRRGMVTFHISGPFNKSRLVERLADMRVETNWVLHVDIGKVDNPMELDTFLFEIIVLGFAAGGKSCICLPTKYIFIEIANTMNNQLKDALHTAMSFKRENLSWQDYDNFIVSNDVNSPVQVVCQYLNALDDGTIDSKDIYFTGMKAACPLPRQKCQHLLRKYFPGPEDMSFNIARIFINVLADQLKKMSCSAFFRTQHLRAALGVKKKVTVKSNLLHALLNTSCEFASRSVNNCRILQASAGNLGSESKAGELPIDSNENSLIKRVEGMIRWEDSNHLIFVFHNQDIQTLSAMYRNKSEVPNHIKDLFESQVQKPLPDFKSKPSSELQDILQRVARTSLTPLPKTKLEDMAKDYALTPDNLLKMILIMLRIKAHIPVLIMGETGCGKTSLVRYLSQICEVSFKVIQIHAGIEEDYILEKIQEVSREAETNLTSPVWLFLDEINTCSYLGLICDILCHHKCLDKTLPPNLIVMAACNPYKLRPEEKILTAGLQGKIKTDEMSHLVYRVFPIPETMVDYVWDFGSISEKDEETYIHRMIQNVFKGSTIMDQLLADLAIMSQRVVCKIEDSESSVSLRDVNRCRLLAKWFQEFQRKKKVHGHCQSKDFHIRCIILALAHCYHSRFANATDRKTYRNRMADVFQCHEIQNYDEDKILDIITEEQRDILNRMELPPGTAQNSALQENVFVILVCILNRIPIFVVGKPGCSKSLSMQVIRSNLRGKDSKDPLFKSLPQLNCVSFQGSESSTSDGIIKVFEKAQRYQENNNPEEVLSVVILDEIGLAEISRFNPLKVLHSLLEPEGKQFPDVAVVGISNWALDAAKMNRAIHLSRPEMNVEELILTGKSISKSMEKKSSDSNHELVRAKSKHLKAVEIDKELKSLADSYMKYVEKQTFANFHGLRDYYSLVKYIARTLSELQTQETIDTMKMKFITRGLQRNFGGLPSELSTLQELFKANLQSSEDYKVPIVDLIVENIQDKMARHLMLITSGDAALDILEQQLSKLGREKITIYGSQFKEDLTDDYNYRILNKIIICMEQGLVLILKDLDSIYGSLYDMLNQNYTMVGEKKNCRVALGPYSNPMCQVHDDFRCIVLVDERKIDQEDPPFLNRFEKQNLKFAAVLSQSEQAVISNLENWVQQLTNVQTKHFEVVDVFPVYSADMVPSLVHRYFLEMEKRGTCSDYEFVNELTALCKQGLIWIMKPESIVRLAYSEFGANSENAEEFNHITNDYIHLPTHEGLQMYLQSEINEERMENNMFMIFTNSNIHTNVQAVLSDLKCQVDKLGAFRSEKQLTYRLQQFWSEPALKLLVLQCKPLDDEEHILLARNLIERTRKEYLDGPCACTKYVCMIMHLDRMKSGSRAVPQINFLTEWKLVMLDSLEQPRMPFAEAVGRRLVDTIEQRRPLCKYIQEQLFWVFTRIQYVPGGRDIDSIDLAIKQIQSSEQFLKILDNAIFKWIEEQQKDIDVKNWQVEVACDTHALYSSATFSDALENYIAQVINDPLARILFELEKLDALSAFFQKNTSDVQSVWEEMFNKPKVFSIQNTPKPTEAECFTCSSPILHFRFPFFKFCYEKIENTKSFFMEAVKTLKSTTGIEDVNEIPDIIWKELLLHQENMIIQEVPELEKTIYNNWLEDYQNDFFNVTSYHIAKGHSKEQRIQMLRCCLLGEVNVEHSRVTAVITHLHIAYWSHSALFHSELELFKMCKEVLEENGGVFSLLQVISTDSKTLGSPLFCRVAQEEQQNHTLDDELLNVNDTLSFVDSLQERDIADNSSDIEACTISDMHDTVWRYDGIPLPETEGSTNANEEKKTTRELLVEHLCKMLLPCDLTLSRYSEVSAWHQKVTNVLAFASQVSMDPSVFHALRLCCDVAVQIVTPLPDKIKYLKQLGTLLQNDIPLDSEKIRDLMRDMILSGKNSQKDNSQKLIAAYCSRCIGANPNTEVFSWLMDFISDQSLPDNMLTNLKSPIHHAIITELGLESEIFFKLLETSDISLEVVERFPFLAALDACLKRLYNGGLLDSPFPALLVDILDHDLMTKRITKDFAEVSATSHPQVQYFLKADKILRSDTLCLRQVTAIAYLRSFLMALSMDLEQRKYDTTDLQVVMQTVNAVLSQNDCRIKSLQVFLLKCLGKDKWIFQLQRICKKLVGHLKCYEEDIWQKDFDLTHVEISPISLHICENISAFTVTFDAAKDMESIVQRAMSSTEEMMCFKSEVMRHFYMKSLISKLNDSERTRSELIVNCAKELNMENTLLVVLECFCGTHDFQVEMLQLHEESPSLHRDLASFVGHLLAIFTGYGCDTGKPVSFFARGLLNPMCLSMLYLPGMPEMVEKKLSQIPSSCFINEDKSFRVLRECSILDLNTSSLHKLDINIECIPCKGYFLQDSFKFEKIAFGSRKMSRLSSLILHLLLHGCLIGSVAVGFASADDICTLTGKTIVFLIKAMETELGYLGAYLGLQEAETIVFLHLVLYQTKSLLCSDNRSMVSETERAEWEKEFSEVVENLTADRFTKILDLRRQQIGMFGLPRYALENLIQEVDDINLIDKTQTMPSLWRSTVAPSFESLVAELEVRKNAFPFLHLALSNLPRIKLLQHIGPILHWHLMCIANVSYTMKKREAEEMKILDFLHKESDEKRRQFIKDKFEQVRKAWDDIMENREALQEFDPEFPQLELIHSQLQLKSCLYDGPQSTIFKVLSTLVCMQNRLIDETLKIAVSVKPLSLSFLRRGEEARISCMLLTDLTSRDVVNFEWDDSILRYSQNNVQYGYGRQIVYDFEKIEAVVASEILTNVKYLIMEDSLPKIIYADELFQNYVAMIQQIKNNIAQEPLPTDLVSAIIKKKERDPGQIMDFLTHLGMILSLLKKTSGNPNTPLVDYVDEWKSVMTRRFPKILLPNPENGIRLCHLVSLHELLEELNADSLIDSLGNIFRVKLTLHAQRQISDLFTENPKLAELTLKAVKRFVHRCLTSLNVDISQRMINYLHDDSFWPLGTVSNGALMHEDLVQDLRCLFPDDITVQNVHPLFQLLASKVEEHKKKDLHMTTMLQSLPSQIITQRPTFNRSRAAKGYSKI